MRKLLKYLFPPKTRPDPVPHQLIAEYDIRLANAEQRLALMSGKARSPQKAQDLFNEWEVSTTQGLLEKLPIKPRIRIRDRLLSILWRIGRHYRGNPYRMHRSDEIPVGYKFKDSQR